MLGIFLQVVGKGKHCGEVQPSSVVKAPHWVLLVAHFSWEVLIHVVWSIRSFVFQVSTSLSLGAASVEAHHYTGHCAGGGFQIPCVAWRGRLL